MRTIQEVDQRIEELNKELENLKSERYRLSRENESYFIAWEYEDAEWSNGVKFKRFGCTTEDKVIDWVNKMNEEVDDEDGGVRNYSIDYSYAEITKEESHLFYDFECVCKMKDASQYHWDNEKLDEVNAILKEEFEILKEKINIKKFTGHNCMSVGIFYD